MRQTENIIQTGTLSDSTMIKKTIARKIATLTKKAKENAKRAM